MSNSIQRKLSKDLEKIERQLSSPDSLQAGNFMGRIVRKLELACTKLEFLFKTGKWESKTLIGHRAAETSIKRLAKDWNNHYNGLKSEKNKKSDKKLEDFFKFNKIVEENILVISKIIDLIKTKSSDKNTLDDLHRMEKRIASYQQFLKSLGQLEPANLSTLQQKVLEQRNVFSPDEAIEEPPEVLNTQKNDRGSYEFLEEMSVEEQTGQEFIEALKRAAEQRQLFERDWKLYRIQKTSNTEDGVIEELTEEEKKVELPKFTEDRALEREARDLALDELEKEYHNDMQLEELTEEEVAREPSLDSHESLEQIEKKLLNEAQDQYLDELQKKYEKELEE